MTTIIKKKKFENSLKYFTNTQPQTTYRNSVNSLSYKHILSNSATQ